jgi:hypothetical protein
MKANCVNVGNHFSVNAGAGIKYNFCKRFNIGYNLGFGCFIKDKVYAVNGSADTSDNDEDVVKMQRRKDFYMQNTLFLGMNF